MMFRCCFRLVGLVALIVLSGCTSLSNSDVDRPVSTADVVVYQDGSGYVYAKSGITGRVISHSRDASTSIQAAIDSLPATGGKVYVSSGSYDLSATILIKDKHGVHLEGAARGMQSGEQGGTVLKSSKPIHIIEIAGESYRVFGVTVSNLLLWGSGNDNGKAGVFVRGTTDAMTLYNVGANNHGIGFHLQGGGGEGSGVNDAPQIYFCDPQRNGTGLVIERSHYTKIVGGEFSDNDTYGIYMESKDPTHQRIQAVKISSVTGVRNVLAGIFIGSNTEDITVTGGTDVGGTREGSGIVVEGSGVGSPPSNIIIGNVHSYNNKVAGVEIGSSNRVLVQGSIITEHNHSAVKQLGQKHSVLVKSGAKNILVTGNVMDRVTDQTAQANVNSNAIGQ